MTYDNVLSIFGLTQTQIEVFIVCGIGLIVVGFVAYMYLHFIIAGAVAFAILTVIAHHEPSENTTVAKNEPKEEYLVDDNIQKASFDPLLLLNLFRFKMDMDRFNQVQQEPVPVPVQEVKETKEIVETEEMKAYVKHCTDLTNNPTMCRENWIAAADSDVELILDPVEKSTKVYVKPTKVAVERKVAEPRAERKIKRVETPVSAVKEVKLLDVDNEEYKARRSAALAKPNAVVIQETYR